MTYFLTALLAAPAMAQDSTTQAIRAWQDLRYGMFIHYGMSTFTGREIDDGDRPSTTYAPTHLDVNQWLRVAKDAGMKYAVLTSKHVAGHCLWDSKVQFRGKEFDYDVATSSDKTDVIAGFVTACKKHGIAPGLYWCLLDYHNNSVPKGPQWTAGMLPEDFYQFAQDQLTELIQNYPDIGYYWLDIPRAASAEQRQVLYDLIKRLRPGTVVMFNHGIAQPNGPITIGTCAAAWPTDVLNTERNPATPGQFTSEQTWQGKTYRLGYEHCDCLGKDWFWTHNDRPRPIRELFRLHRDTLAGGGNLLLDVPPDRSGRIPEASVKALLELKRAIDDPPMFPVPLNFHAKVNASNIWHQDANFRPECAVDDNTGSRWATDDGVTSAWLEVDLGKPVGIGRVVIEQAYPELKRVRKFAIEYRQGDEWKPCYQGENLGATLDTAFPPVTARHVRLNLTECTDGPTISEFQLFPPQDR
ncbi:MAG: alpha-L-fucosidase [Akkermansiaceae bacterium]|nr:alpha-L-fucosidase [Akkermansiaceae bacterium]